jgi:orotidine-5'-phosphate decarboxylase
MEVAVSQTVPQQAPQNIDRLYEAVQARGHVCVGLDTRADYVPDVERRRAANDGEAILGYNKALVRATLDVAACYKVQIAYYEALGREGLDCYARTLAFLREAGALVIADIKRGDIAETAAQYAAAHFSGDFEADFVTLSPYLGMDSLAPWLAYADSKGKGAFVLARTSNKGSADFQAEELVRGGRLYHAVADKLTALAAEHYGLHGYGSFGAVVGCTERTDAAALRERMAGVFFLIPGYGAQGGGALEASLLLKDGNGGVVNASRSLLCAWKQQPQTACLSDTAATDNEAAASMARKAAIEMRDAIQAAL